MSGTNIPHLNPRIQRGDGAYCKTSAAYFRSQTQVPSPYSPRYPSPVSDLRLRYLETTGALLVWTPTEGGRYPLGIQTTSHPPMVSSYRLPSKLLRYSPMHCTPALTFPVQLYPNSDFPRTPLSEFPLHLCHPTTLPAFPVQLYPIPNNSPRAPRPVLRRRRYLAEPRASVQIAGTNSAISLRTCYAMSDPQMGAAVPFFVCAYCTFSLPSATALGPYNCTRFPRTTLPAFSVQLYSLSPYNSTRSPRTTLPALPVQLYPLS
eukprot:613167-Rhodomonas_salina.1